MKKIKKIFAFILSVFLVLPVFADCVKGHLSSEKIKIWKNISGIQQGSYSTLSVYRALNTEGSSAENQKRAAVIICPGGSYHHLGLFHEGKDVALWFQSIGVNAFVLKYRTSGKGCHHPAMLQDIQRSIQIVRENADDFGVDVNKVGAIGFSAGGHLVLMAASFYESDDELKKLGIKTDVSIRPDFVIPVYPVVSMQQDIGHEWSRESLLGKDQSQERRDYFSMEKQVKKGMCPVFILTNKDDRTVMYQNSVRLDEALTAAGVPHKFILGEIGDHGFGMGNNKFVHSTNWNDEWLKPWLCQIGALD